MPSTKLVYAAPTGTRMIKRIGMLAVFLALAASLGGCSKCGFWWDDAPKACKDDIRK